MQRAQKRRCVQLVECQLGQDVPHIVWSDAWARVMTTKNGAPKAPPVTILGLTVNPRSTHSADCLDVLPLTVGHLVEADAAATDVTLLVEPHIAADARMLDICEYR